MENIEPLVGQLFVVIKRKLKAKSLTYRDVAYALSATEISVKRWFAEERLTIRQLSAVAHLLGLTLTELMQEAEEPPLQQLSFDQETELASDWKLLLMVRCVLSNMTLAQIVAEFEMTEAECIQYLVQLDRLRVIDLLPDNQIRVRISRDFDLLPNGPLQKVVMDRRMSGFLDSGFTGKHEGLLFLRGSLSAEAIKQFEGYARQLKRKLAELNAESLSIPLEQRHSFSAVIVHREWEPDLVTALRRRR